MTPKSCEPQARGTEKLSSARYQIPPRNFDLVIEERGLSLLSERRMGAKRIPPCESSSVSLSPPLILDVLPVVVASVRRCPLMRAVIPCPSETKPRYEKFEE